MAENKTNCSRCGRPIKIQSFKVDPTDPWLSRAVENRHFHSSYYCNRCYDKAHTEWKAEKKKAEKPITTTRQCGACSGKGRIKGYECQACDGRGSTRETRKGSYVHSYFGEFPGLRCENA